MQEENISIKTPEYVSLEFHPAGLGSRALAFMIDQLVLMLASILIIVIAAFSMTALENMFVGGSPGVPLAIAIFLIFFLNVGYYLILEYFTGGRTIGKKALRIRVIQDNGHSITLLSSIIRNFMRLVDSLPTGYLVGILMIFFHSKHKRLGDVVAGTIVVHERGKKKEKRKSPLEQEILQRGLSKDYVSVEDWSMKALGTKEWKLMKVYADRFVHLPYLERAEFTRELADVLFPKVGLSVESKNNEELENMLLALYMRMREEWEYEL